jgi:two-component system NtrC family sensor kinase
MHLRLSLQGRVLLLIAGAMALIVLLSAYLHQVITRSLIEDDRYNTAISGTVAIAARIAALQLFTNPEALQRDIQIVANAPQDFEQVDVFQRAGQGLRLAASTAPSAARLPALNGQTADNELREMERPLPEVVTMEVLRNGVRYWVISSAFRVPTGTGYVTALVRKNSFNPIIGVVQIRHNLVLCGAVAVCVGLLYLLFEHLFRRPARNIVRAIALARRGDFSSRAVVRRDDELGEIARGFNVMMDVLSARDREREELLTRIGRFNDELSEEVARATGEVRAANDALLQSQQRLGRSERLAAMGHVAASLAHEIGTPLNSISGHLNLLARRMSHDPDARRRVAIISQQLDSIVTSVRALLQRTHKRRHALRPADLNALIGEWLRLVGPTLDAGAIRVSAALGTALPPVAADPEGLQHVFLNLVNNSIDAMPDGGRLEITTRAHESGRFAELTVQDSGPGIASDALEHLFEPMWTSKPTGSGFGLSIAREILAQHGGAIDVDPEAVGGALFRLRVPLAEVPHGA